MQVPQLLQIRNISLLFTVLHGVLHYFFLCFWPLVLGESKGNFLEFPHTFMVHQMSRKSELCAKLLSSFYLFDRELKPFIQSSEEYVIKGKYYGKVYLISLFHVDTDRIEFILLEVTRISYYLKSKFHQPLPNDTTI